MINVFLSIIAVFFAGIGFVIIANGYFGPTRYKKTVYKQEILIWLVGVLLVFISGLIVIYFYSLCSVSERILEEASKYELPDLGLGT